MPESRSRGEREGHGRQVCRGRTGAAPPGGRRRRRRRAEVRAVAGERGASFVEVSVVLALATILVGAAWPGFAAWLDVVDLRGATLHLSSALARGRAAALSEGRTWEIRVAGPRSFVLAPEGEDGVPATLPGTATFAAATSGGDVRFFSSGLAENATFTLAAGDALRRVIVNQRGRVTVE